MPFSNGVVTYVPTCSEMSANEANLPDSAEFLADQVSYYTGQIPSMVRPRRAGGGGESAVHCILFYHRLS